jgi:hypothetical protein
MVFCCTRLASQARQSISNQKSDMPSPLCGFLLHTSEGFGKHALSVTLSGKGGSPMPPTVRMLKSAAWGQGGELHGEKLLKARKVIAFFKTAKNPSAEAKPGLMGGVQSICNHSAYSSSR